MIKIELSTSLTKLSNDCFSYCEKLTNFITPEKWSIHENKIFNNETHLISFDIPSRIKMINGKEYKYSELKTYEIPTYVTSLGNYLFSNFKELESITFHSNIKEIGGGCFYNCPKLKIEEKLVKESKRKQIWLNDEQINKIEEWTRMKNEKVIFDSEIDKWKMGESEFDKIIINKQNIIILIENEEGIKIGGFISSKIDKITNYDDEEEENEEWIADEKSFVFTFKDNKSMKYDIKKDKQDKAFCLYHKSHLNLFSIGNNDIVIEKIMDNTRIYQNERSSFDYEGKENALIGKTGYLSTKRIIVIQMK